MGRHDVGVLQLSRNQIKHVKERMNKLQELDKTLTPMCVDAKNCKECKFGKVCNELEHIHTTEIRYPWHVPFLRSLPDSVIEFLMDYYADATEQE